TTMVGVAASVGSPTPTVTAVWTAESGATPDQRATVRLGESSRDAEGRLVIPVVASADEPLQNLDVHIAFDSGRLDFDTADTATGAPVESDIVTTGHLHVALESTGESTDDQQQLSLRFATDADLPDDRTSVRLLRAEVNGRPAHCER